MLTTNWYHDNPEIEVLRYPFGNGDWSANTMEHSVDCRRPDVFESVDYQSCLNCGSVYYGDSTVHQSEDHRVDDPNGSASEPTDGDTVNPEDRKIRYGAPQDDKVESSVASVGSSRPDRGHLGSHSIERFRYRAINQKQELRLLRIQQAPSFEDPIQCTLVHESLRQVLPPFEAVSYTWADESGNSSKQAAISLDSKSFRITTNCERALRRIRLKTRSRLVWIDAICINQESETEKTHQVQLMAQIYARATRVLVYVGEARDQSSRLLEILGDSRNGEHDCETAIRHEKLQKPLADFLSRPYFWRVWVLQEIALAKQAFLICGDRSISWSILAARNTRKLLGPSFKLHPSHLLSKPNVLRALEAFQSNQGSFLTALPPALGFKRPVVRDIPQLLPLLDTSSFCDASDPRDKVYALLGLITGLEPLGFLPDYSETVEDIYVDIALLLAQECGPMAILTRAVCRPSVSRRRSWVPDWRHPPGYITANEHLEKMNGSIEATKPTKRDKSGSSSSKPLRNGTVNFTQQDTLQITMSMVCTMYDLLVSDQMLGMVDIQNIKITILSADDAKNGPIELEIYPGVQYQRLNQEYPSVVNRDASWEQVSIWLKSLTIHAPWPTTNSLQKSQLEYSRLDVLQRQCHVLLEYPHGTPSKSAPTSLEIGSSRSPPGRGTAEPGVFRGLCMFSLIPGPATTSQTRGFWYQKAFISDNNFVDTEDHRLGWHKQQMKSKTYQLADLEKLVAGAPNYTGSIPFW